MAERKNTNFATTSIADAETPNTLTKNDDHNNWESKKTTESEQKQTAQVVVDQEQSSSSNNSKDSKSSESCSEVDGDGDRSAVGGGTLPNIYNKFVTSFENALHELIDEEEPKAKQQKLSSLDLEGVAAYIREQQPNIVFMVGAGISTSAGIPDFRTPGTGLYDNLSGYNIPTPHSIFEVNYFKKKPEPFFVLAKELFHENIKPTAAHYFIKLIEEKGLLRRCFTQNIDSLEFLAGLSEDKVVAAHGSHRSSTCLSCKRKYGYEWFIEKLRNPEIKVPRCEHCGKGIVKPDIVFFGESLPSRFFSTSLVDLPKCELLIIMGTSLVVHPFASLVDNVPEDTPRLLINLVPVGMDLLSYMESGNTRDVFYQSDCDEAVFRFARLLGWEDELKAMVNADAVS